MTMRKALLACGLLALPTTLGGCVAAVAAIPVLAGGTMATGGGSDDSKSRPPVDQGAALPLPPFAREPAPQPQPAAVAPVAAAGPVEAAGPGAGAPLEQPAEEELTAVTEPRASQPPGVGRAVSAQVTAPIPAPVPGPVTGPATGPASAPMAAPVAASASTAVGATATPLENPYGQFVNYALTQAARDPVESPRKSALLATPGSLSPETVDCAIRPPAVLVDLDPADQPLAVDQPVAPNRRLAEALAALRMREVEVFWISGISAAQAGTLRDRLLASGLDTSARDRLLLMRSGEDRKQLRRRELAGTHCVVAIAGDARTDFDELFDYLKNPAAAAPLDALVGEGWFLVPAPFVPEDK